MYVRPLYLRASGGRIPELKRVIVVYQNTIVMAETLEGAIDQIFPRGGRRPGAPGAGPETTGGPDTTAGAGGTGTAGAGPEGSGGGSAGAAAGTIEAASGAAAGAAATGMPASSAAETTALARLAAEADTHYQRALKAQREGNWALYGEELKRLGEVLERMKKSSR